ncbi:hypothetical protein ACFO1B_29485 [Dactylosporangium siamense]|uniref:Uncharacterized protein n=1 Tax=Dactylosporangium siamense TaxID=685454 RepID=A0A919UGX8_9ACTN|nr:hypothetical protein [Dactylosporangium siamense]GIG51821.1 hypothetical protein Dsi01nite_098620 [Dactylosporangium siamense]
MRTRRTVLLGLAAGALTIASGRPIAKAHADATGPAYAAIRVVRATAGTPERPEITVPAGYSLLAGPQYQVASRAEFTAFVQGPVSGGVPVVVRWPGQAVRAVIAGDRRLPLTSPDGTAGTVAVDLPVAGASPLAESPTIQVWSRLSDAGSGILWLAAHNHPDRAAGYWATRAWPAGEVHAVVTYLAACDEILRDSGAAAEARRRGHFFALEGFETNNPLHQDNPPHWHLSYYPGATTRATPATVPHFWVDERGRTFYNGQDVTGQGRSRFSAGQPAPIRDGAGTLVLTTVIRADGGLDVIPPSGPAYSITSATGDYTGPVEVRRGGASWRMFTTDDLVRDGVLRVEGGGATVEHRYDPLTGAELSTAR